MLASGYRRAGSPERQTKLRRTLPRWPGIRNRDRFGADDGAAELQELVLREAQLAAVVGGFGDGFVQDVALASVVGQLVDPGLELLEASLRSLISCVIEFRSGTSCVAWRRS